MNKRTQELIQLDPFQAPNKYIETATKWTDGKQSLQLFTKKGGNSVNQHLTEYILNIHNC